MVTHCMCMSVYACTYTCTYAYIHACTHTHTHTHTHWQYFAGSGLFCSCIFIIPCSMYVRWILVHELLGSRPSVHCSYNHVPPPPPLPVAVRCWRVSDRAVHPAGHHHGGQAAHPEQPHWDRHPVSAPPLALNNNNNLIEIVIPWVHHRWLLIIITTSLRSSSRECSTAGS